MSNGETSVSAKSRGGRVRSFSIRFLMDSGSVRILSRSSEVGSWAKDVEPGPIRIVSRHNRLANRRAVDVIADWLSGPFFGTETCTADRACFVRAPTNVR